MVNCEIILCCDLSLIHICEAMKVYGGDTSVAPTSDDVEQATSVFREELEVVINHNL